MYATKRTVNKAKGTRKEHFRTKSHRPNAGGRFVYTQVIRNEHGLVIKTIHHDATGEGVFNLRKRRRRLRKSMSSQPK